MAGNHDETQFSGLIDLASEDIGGRALAASDEFFAGRENLLKAGRGVFLPDEYTDRGKWMDGWEPRRRRTPGHDWCIIELGAPGVVRAVNVDTNHFLGNHPPFASIEGCHAPGASTESLIDEAEWTPIVSALALKAGSENLATTNSDKPWTHLRLNIYPAGGVARFRAWGTATRPDASDDLTNLAAIESGALPLCCSDMFFSPMTNLILPQPAMNMGQGWETRRGRPPTDDWVVLKLSQPGRLKKFVLDTAFFKGNFPERCHIEALHWPDAPPWMLVESPYWTQITATTRLGPDQRHEVAVEHEGPWTHVRLCIFPDGGVSRLRALGYADGKPPAKDREQLNSINDADEADLRAALQTVCGATRWVDAMMTARPFPSITALHGEAERAWWSLSQNDWLEAFEHHPKIGADLAELEKKFGDTAELSSQEQAGVRTAAPATLAALRDANIKYQEKFGYIFIVCATGRSAQDMLEILEQRLPNTLANEIRIAAGEQMKITHLRLAAIGVQSPKEG